MSSVKKTMQWVLPIWVSAVMLLRPSGGSNILGLFPHPGYSHFRVFYPLLKALAEKGHQLTVITFFQAPEKHPNYNEFILEGKTGVSVIDLDFEPSRSLQAMYEEFWALADEGRDACERFFDSKAPNTILKKHAGNPFDLIIMEFFNTDCLVGFSPLLSVPIVALSSCALMPWHYERFGLPDYPSYITTEFVGFHEDMDYKDRLINFIVTKGIKLLYRLIVEPADNKIIRDNLKISVDVSEVVKQTRLILLNQHHSLSGARPLTPKVIEVGGLHIDASNRTLPKSLDEFLNSADNGVIFVSWGSMVRFSSIPTSKLEAIVNVLRKVPQKIVWKWETEQFPVADVKFLFIPWAPQKDILCHHNTKLFWSHGGLLGVSEGVHCGVPMIVTPIYGDQFTNGKSLEHRDIGKILPFNQINEENLLSLIPKVLSLNKNATIISTAFRNRQNTPLETALWWVEDVLQHPGNDLSYSSSVNLNWFVYHSLDVVFTIIGFIFVIASAVVISLRLTCKYLFCKNRQEFIKAKKLN